MHFYTKFVFLDLGRFAYCTSQKLQNNSQNWSYLTCLQLNIPFLKDYKISKEVQHEVTCDISEKRAMVFMNHGIHMEIHFQSILMQIFLKVNEITIKACLNYISKTFDSVFWQNYCSKFGIFR